MEYDRNVPICTLWLGERWWFIIFVVIIRDHFIYYDLK